MINVAAVINSRAFAQPFTIQRSTGSFVLGGWQDNTTPVQAYGAITVADANTLNMIPEGDRPTGAMAFYWTSEIYETHTDPPGYGEGGSGQGGYGGPQGISDIICWRNQNYRIVKVWPQVDYGYWKAVGVRMSGE